MQYDNIREAVFLKRPNRFIAEILVDGQQEIAHVKNTGRCKELLTDKAKIYVQYFPEGKRKTKYDLIAVQKGELLINMDSQAPNKVVQEWLLKNNPWGEITLCKPEYTLGKSRFDFYVEMGERRLLLEVKGVTLEDQGVVLFPDAPTERGLKHVRELQELNHQGYETAVMFVVQLEQASYFTPNKATQSEFAEALKLAQAEGTKLLAYTCRVEPDRLEITEPLEIRL